MIAGKTYYYKLRHKTARGDLSDYSSVKSAASLAEASDDNTLKISCISGSRSIANGKAYYKSGDALSIIVTSQLPLVDAPTVVIDDDNSEHSVTVDSSTADYLSNSCSYTVQGTEEEGTVILRASAVTKIGETSIKTEENIMLDFVAPTVTGTPIIIDSDNDLKSGDDYAYEADKIWISITDDVLDTSGDPSEASGLNKVYLQNAFVGVSTSTPGDTLVDSILANIFSNDDWKDYYLIDSGDHVYQILGYTGATGTFALDDTCDDGIYYVTKYYPTDTAHYSDWKNYDVGNRQVIIWDLIIDMPYDPPPDTTDLDTDHKYRVIARFTDNALNFSNLCSDDIYFDGTAPTAPVLNSATGELESIVLNFTTPDNVDLDKLMEEYTHGG